MQPLHSPRLSFSEPVAPTWTAFCTPSFLFWSPSAAAFSTFSTLLSRLYSSSLLLAATVSLSRYGCGLVCYLPPSFTSFSSLTLWSLRSNSLWSVWYDRTLYRHHRCSAKTMTGSRMYPNLFREYSAWQYPEKREFLNGLFWDGSIQALRP